MNRLYNLFFYLKWIFWKRHFYKLSIDGYLKEHGYFTSSVKGYPSDDSGNHLPWLTYPFLDFFLPKLPSDLLLFEFGLGSSTIFFNLKKLNAYGVEHDRSWYEKTIDHSITDRYLLAGSVQEYTQAIYRANISFDVVIIDGVYRTECVGPAVNCLSEGGIIVLDNSEQHPSAYSALLKFGFRAINFTGLQSLGYKTTTTTLFYRSNNWIGL